MSAKRNIALLGIVYLTAVGVFIVQRVQTEATQNKATCLTSSGTSADIIYACTSLIKHADPADTELPQYLYKRSLAFMRRDTFGDALADLDRAVALDPDSWKFIGQRGYIHYRMENDGAALADLNAALRFNPKSTWALNARGNVYGALDEEDKALADYESVLALNPRHKWALRNRAYLLFRTGQTGQAMAAYDALFEAYPDDSWALSRRASWLEDQGRIAEAIADLERALVTNPEDSETRSVLWVTCADYLKVCLASPNAATPAESALTCTQAKAAIRPMLPQSDQNDLETTDTRWLTSANLFGRSTLSLLDTPNQDDAEMVIVSAQLVDCYADDRIDGDWRTELLSGTTPEIIQSEFSRAFTPQLRRAAVELAMRYLEYGQ